MNFRAVGEDRGAASEPYSGNSGIDHLHQPQNAQPAIVKNAVWGHGDENGDTIESLEAGPDFERGIEDPVEPEEDEEESPKEDDSDSSDEAEIKEPDETTETLQTQDQRSPEPKKSRAQERIRELANDRKAARDENRLLAEQNRLLLQRLESHLGTQTKLQQEAFAAQRERERALHREQEDALEAQRLRDANYNEDQVAYIMSLRAEQQQTRNLREDVAELKRTLTVQSERAEIQRYEMQLARELDDRLEGYDVDTKTRARLYKMAHSLAAAEQIGDPRQAVEAVLEPYELQRSKKKAPSPSSRPPRPSVSTDRAAAARGRSSGRAAGERAGGKRGGKESVEDIEKEWGVGNRW